MGLGADLVTSRMLCTVKGLINPVAKGGHVVADLKPGGPKACRHRSHRAEIDGSNRCAQLFRQLTGCPSVRSRQKQNELLTPPQRANVSVTRTRSEIVAATRFRTVSPASWPKVSLTRLKWSMSNMMSDNGAPWR